MNINNSIAMLPLKFKGNRPYLQGGDILFCLLSLIEFASKIRFQLHHMSSTNLQAHLSNEDEISSLRSNKDLHAFLMYNDKMNKENIVAVTESFQTTTPERIEYREDLVIKNAEIYDESKIRQKIWTEGNVFERIVALNKLLLNETILHHPWIFSRFDLDYYPIENGPIDIHLTRQIGNHTYISQILLNDITVGKIYFSRRAK